MEKIDYSSVGYPNASDAEAAQVRHERYLALDLAIKTFTECPDPGEILVAALLYEAYLRTGAVPSEDEDE